MRQLFTRMLLLLLFITPVMTLARPLIEEGGQWTNLTVKNFFPNSKKLQYIFQVQNRLNTRNNVFDSTFIRGALDYTVNPSINIWVGYDFRYIYNETNNRLVIFPHFTGHIFFRFYAAHSSATGVL
ncbi:DUF2490 domain-containing protein [Candidiatus Paracoxiella cheracis]|uniref:DUF2490 domain-containing protein n=1 Tax=Candidiatus Paracoxiella cheracis TaxID=3405120 RepID=UPI003BF5C4F0